MHLNLLFYIGLIFLLSQVAGRLANLAGAPRIVGYLLCGIIIGPYSTGLVSETMLNGDLHLVQEASLAIIAYLIGESLLLSDLKKFKVVIPTVALIQGVVCFIAVAGLLAPLFYQLNSHGNGWWQTALLLAAINVATAPATILAIVDEYRAQGNFTTILLGIIAIDDAIAVLLFSMTFFFLASGNLLLFVGHHIFLPIAIGLGMSAFLSLLDRFALSKTTVFGLSFGSILLTTGLCLSFETSIILGLMTFGFYSANFNKDNQTLVKSVSNIEEPVLAVFFVMAGAHLQLGGLGEVLLLGMAMTLARFIGKYSGTYLSAAMTSAGAEVKKYMGIALMPQAGVAIALAFEARKIVGDGYWQHLLVSIILGAIVINELIAPFLVVRSLKKAGDIQLQEP